MKSVAELAAEFDRSFAEPARVARERGGDALVIRAGGARHVVSLAAIDVIRFSETSRVRRTCASFQRLVASRTGCN